MPYQPDAPRPMLPEEARREPLRGVMLECPGSIGWLLDYAADTGDQQARTATREALLAGYRAARSAFQEAAAKVLVRGEYVRGEMKTPSAEHDGTEGPHGRQDEAYPHMHLGYPNHVHLEGQPYRLEVDCERQALEQSWLAYHQTIRQQLVTDGLDTVTVDYGCGWEVAEFAAEPRRRWGCTPTHWTVPGGEAVAMSRFGLEPSIGDLILSGHGPELLAGLRSW